MLGPTVIKNNSNASANGKRKDEDVTVVASSVGDKKKKVYKCFFCKESGHFILDCPELAKKNGGNITSVFIQDTGFYGEEYGYSLMSAVSFDELIASVNFLGQLDEYDALLDSGANKSIWKSMHILSDVRTDVPISTRGVNGSYSETNHFG